MFRPSIPERSPVEKEQKKELSILDIAINEQRGLLDRTETKLKQEQANLKDKLEEEREVEKRIESLKEKKRQEEITYQIIKDKTDEAKQEFFTQNNFLTGLKRNYAEKVEEVKREAEILSRAKEKRQLEIREQMEDLETERGAALKKMEKLKIEISSLEDRKNQIERILNSFEVKERDFRLLILDLTDKETSLTESISVLEKRKDKSNLERIILEQDIKSLGEEKEKENQRLIELKEQIVRAEKETREMEKAIFYHVGREEELNKREAFIRKQYERANIVYK